jgi:hypothetical protein
MAKKQAASNLDQELLARIDERQRAMDEKLDLIHAETKRTNGRVTKLEDWKSRINGAWIAIAFVGPIIGAFVTWLIQILIK